MFTVRKQRAGNPGAQFLVSFFIQSGTLDLSLILRTHVEWRKERTEPRELASDLHHLNCTWHFSDQKYSLGKRSK